MSLPPLPEGATLDESPGDLPPLPEGATLDAAPEPAPAWGFSAQELSEEVESTKAVADAEERTARLSRIRLAFDEAQRFTEDDATKAVAIAKQLKVPFDTVRANLRAFEETAAAAKFNEQDWEKANPDLARVLTQNPDLGPLVMRSKDAGPIIKAFRAAGDWLQDAWDNSLQGTPEQIAAEQARAREFQIVPDPEDSAAKNVTPLTQDERVGRETARAKRDGPQQVLERDDEKARFLRESPDLSARVITGLARAKETAKGLEAAALQTKLMWAEVAEEQGWPGADAAPELRARVADLELDSQPRAYGDDTGLARSVSIAIQGGTSTALTIAEGAKGAGAAGGAAFAVAGGATFAATRSPALAFDVGAAAASRIAPMGFKASSAWQTFQWEAGSTNKELRELRTEKGLKLTATEAAGGAVLAGMMKTGLEMFSLGQQTKVLAGPLGSKWRELLVKDPSFRKMVANLGKEWLSSVVTEGSTEGLQNIVDQLATYVSASLTDGEAQKRQAIDVESVMQDVEAGFMAAAAMGGAAAPVHMGMHLALTDESATTARQITSLGEMAKLPEVQAAPSEFAAMVRQATSEDGGRAVTALHVDAQAIVRFYQGKNQTEAASELDALLGENGAQRVAEAAVTGQRLEIPMDVVLGKWGGSAVGQALLQDAATTPDGMTLRERSPERLKAIREEAKRIAEAAEKEQDATEKTLTAVDEVERELRSVGYTAKEASTAGALWKHFWRVTGQRAGLTPEDMAQRMRATFHLVADGPLVTDTAVGLSQRFISQDVSTPEGKRARESDFYVDTTTGLLNARAFKRLERGLGDAQQVAAISIEGVKFANDTMGGHQSGDALYRAAAQALYSAAVELGIEPAKAVAKVGGDFGIAGVSSEELAAIIAKANENPVLQGFTLSGAVGPSYRAAAKTANDQKAQAEKAKERAERGARPLRAVPDLKPHEAEKVADVQVPEALQQALAELAPEEAFVEAFIDEKTGLLNKDGRDAFLEAHPKKFMASIDMNLLKPYNRLFAEGTTEEVGEALADQVLFAFGRVIADLGGGDLVATHVSGDEFTLHSDNEAELRAFLADLDRVGRSATFRVAEDGVEKLVDGVTFGAGVGETVEQAEEELHGHKQRLEVEGSRSSDAARALEIARRTVRLVAQDDSGGPAEGEGSGREGEVPGTDDQRQVVSPRTGRKGIRPQFLSEEALAAALGLERVAGQARRLTPSLLAKSREEIAEVRKDIAKRRNPTLKAQAEAWLDYTLGGPLPRGPNAPSDAMIKAFARDGFVDPDGFKYDESGRSLERSIGGRKRNNPRNAAERARLQDARKAFMMNVHGKTVLRQPGEKDARGFIEMPTAGDMMQTFRVFLNPSADISTVAHESAHAFLGILQHLSLQPETPQAIKDDYAAALKWLGSEDGKITEDMHEKWARGFEAYLFEGKAPSSALERVFTRFSLWLRSIYRSVKALNVELSPEIRGVFDRLLATEEEIAKHRGERGPALPAEALLLSPEEAFKRSDDDFVAEAFATRKAALHAAKERLREMESWWKEERKAHLRQALEDYEALPARVARAILDGESELNGMMPVTLQREAVEAAVGKTRKVRQEKDGAHPDAVAPFAGFATGKEMLEAVLALPEKLAWAEEQADARMKEAHPSVLEDRTALKKLVADGFHQYAQSRIARELKELHQRAKLGEPSPKEVLQEAARLMVEGRTARRLDAGGALRAERAAAREKAAAAARGEWDRAIGAARRELLNAYLYEELQKARDEREALEERASDLAKKKARARMGKVSPIYRDSVEALLGAVGLGASEAPFDEGALESLRQQLARDNIVAGEWADTILDELKPDYADMTMRGVRDVTQALDQVATAVRLREHVVVDGKRVQKEAVVQQVVNEIASYLRRKKATATELAQTTVERAVRRANAIDGFLVSVVDLVRDLTNDDQNSMLWKVTVLAAREAKHREADILRTAIKPVLEAFDAMPAEVRAKMMESIDGLKLFPNHTDLKQVPRKRIELLMMALNAGNESNLSRLLEGRQITMPQLEAALGLLTAEELKWVQSVWDAMESLKEPSFDLEERLTGLRPEGIEARPITLKNGTLRGGYFPAVYDRDSTIAGQQQAASALADLMDPSYVRPGTPHSHLKSRKEGFSSIISLDPNIIAHHLGQAAHDIAFREVIMSIGNIVLDPAVQQALTERLGAEKSRRFLEWVKDMATMRGQLVENALHPIMSKLRENMATGLLGYNSAVAFGDFSNFAFALAASSLKAKHLGAAAAEVLKSPVESYEVAFEKSGEFRTMQDTLQRDFLREMKKLTAEGVFETGAISWYKDHAFAFLEATQVMVATPVWHGAYRQALAEGQTEAEAVRFADDVLVKTFPQHSAVEAAGILRDKGYWGMSTMFYGFVSRVYVAQHAHLRPLFSMEFWDSPAAKKALTLGKVGGRLMGLWLAADLLGSVLMARGPEDGDRDEEEPDNELLQWRNWAMRKLLLAPLAQLPFEIAPLLERFILKKQTNPRASIVSGALEALGKAGLAAWNDPASYRTVEAIMRALALWKGVPQSPFVKQGRVVHDVIVGDKDPSVTGLLYGR